jgi:hypothetical protein
MKRVRLNIDGVLLLDKPIGPSSNDALQRARRALNAAKAGHGGTLDPMASGLLPIAFGEATKFLHDLLDQHLPACGRFYTTSFPTFRVVFIARWAGIRTWKHHFCMLTIWSFTCLNSAWRHLLGAVAHPTRVKPDAPSLLRP